MLWDKGECHGREGCGWTVGLYLGLGYQLLLWDLVLFDEVLVQEGLSVDLGLGLGELLLKIGFEVVQGYAEDGG